MKRIFINGFYSFTDLLTTAYKVKSIAINVCSFLLANFVSFAGFIYNPHEMSVLLFVLMLVDWATGVYKAVKFKRFSSYTFQRMMWNIFFTSLLVGSSTLLAKHMWAFRALHIADVMITGFLITYLVSIIENLHEIDKRIIPDKFYLNIKNMLNLDKVLAKHFNTSDATKEDLAKGVDGALHAEPDLSEPIEDTDEEQS